MTNDLHTLSGAYAVNALSAEEAELFSRHLEDCPACRDEVRELQEAAAKMGASQAVVPPRALKARVLAAADQLPQLPPRVTPITQARSRRLLVRLGSVAAAAVLAVAAGIGITQMRDSEEPAVMARSVTKVFEAPDTRTKTVTTDLGKLKVATSPSLDMMAVDTGRLKSPGAEKVYQMWAVKDGTASSVGLIEDLDAGKAMPMPGEGTTVAITVEPAGGSGQPTTQPIVNVDPAAV